MPEPRFTHLHVHTHYSLLDGANKIPELVKRTKALGMDSLAITDHGCMFGVVEFFNECKKEGIKPILGMEAYMAPGDRRERSTPGGNAGEAAFHLLLLAQDLQGYRNLIKLSSISYREGFYYKPRIDKEVLRELSAGLIATSACLGGEVCSAFMKRDAKAARAVAETYVDIFGADRFFIEVQKQGIREQDMVNPELAELSKKLGVGLVATNDVHFLNKEDHYAHDVLCCISMGKLITDENRLKYPTELYLKSPAEMISGCGQFDQSIENTVEIAKRCNLELDFSKRYAPVYRVPKEFEPRRHQGTKTVSDDEAFLRDRCEKGLAWRYGTTDVPAEVRERLEYELKIIELKKFCSYFLIVWDFCNFAREHGIPVGARGSGVGTMVGYLLGLCNVDPLKYGLLFERFMDPSRNEMPDIDIDICQDGRARIIEYVRNKYGHVAQIITFGTLAAKAACKDVGRVLGVPLKDIDALTKLIPGVPGMTIDKAMSQVPDLKALYTTNNTIRGVIDVAKRLEGLCRNAGVHAAGVIIADQPLDEVIPLCKDKEDNVLTQFEGPISEKCGLLKMDFLGLRTLSTLQRSIDLVKQTKGVEIDIEHIDFTDKKVLALFGRGETKGIFQFESGGMQDLLMKMRPDRLEDLIAANALYRPGPMELIPLYCARKHKREALSPVHPVMDRILDETYAIMVYQEQVMQIFNQLGGIELSAAYKLIKAISKKQTDVIAKYKPDFIKGAMSQGIDKSSSEQLFELILKFGGYGFNKSHSTRYAIVAFQTAYMKIYHPVEYMSALLTFEMGNTDKVVEYIEECRRMAVKVLPPDVNSSDKDFTPIYTDSTAKKRKSEDKAGVIRFGMCAVRGVGTKAVEAIIAERNKRGLFSSIFDFCDRVDLRAVQRATIEALIKCGAFASLGANRAQLLNALDGAFDAGQRAQDDVLSGQLSMFGANAAIAPRISSSLPDIKEFASAELLKFEKDLLGFYITSHPLTEHQAMMERYISATTRESLAMTEGSEVLIGGMITRVKKTVTKTGKNPGQSMGWITVEDLDGSIECTLFPDAYAQITTRSPGVIANESIVMVRGKIDRKRETPSIIVSELFPIAEASQKLTTGIAIKFDGSRHSADLLRQLPTLLKKHKGNIDVFAQVETDQEKVTMKLPRDFNIRPTSEFTREFDQTFGEGVVQLFGAGQKRLKRIAQQKEMFKNAAPIDTTPVPISDDQIADAMDAELE